jgi:hypothetical protein
MITLKLLILPSTSTLLDAIADAAVVDVVGSAHSSDKIHKAIDEAESFDN